MKKILIIFSGTRNDIDIIKEILKREGKNVFIKVVFILSEAIPSNFSTWLMYMGFLGEEPTKEIKDLILKEIENNLREKMEKLGNFLKEEKISCEFQFLKGDFCEMLEDIIKEGKWDSVYSPKSKEVLIGEEKIKKEFNVKEI